MTFNINWGGPGYASYDGEMKGATQGADAQRLQELDMQKQAFASQQKMIEGLNSATSRFMTGTSGYDDATKAAMRSQFLNNNSQTFNQAGNQVRAALGARGEGTGSQPVGGAYGSGISNLMGAQASSQSQGLLGLNIQNANMGLQNMWNAMNIRSGNAATLTGTQGVSGAGASSALNSYVQASNQGFGASFGNAFGGALGKTLGTFGSSSGPGGTSSSWGG